MINNNACVSTVLRLINGCAERLWYRWYSFRINGILCALNILFHQPAHTYTNVYWTFVHFSIDVVRFIFICFCFILPSLSSSIGFNFPLCIFTCVYVRLLAVFIFDNGISMLRTLTCFFARLSLFLLRFTVHTMSNEWLSFDKHSICTYICYIIMSSHFDLITSTELESLIILTVINAFFCLFCPFFLFFFFFSPFLTTFFSLYFFSFSFFLLRLRSPSFLFNGNFFSDSIEYLAAIAWIFNHVRYHGITAIRMYPNSS